MRIRLAVWIGLIAFAIWAEGHATRETQIAAWAAVGLDSLALLVYMTKVD